MSVSEQTARIALRSIDDLVGMVPYLLGFHPTESLVILLLEEGRVVVSARVDLTAAARTGTLDDLVARLFGRFPAAEAWFLTYTDDDDLGWRVLASCVELAGIVRLGRVLQVRHDSWRADHPAGPTGVIAATSVVAAEATVLGLTAMRSRADLADRLAGPPDDEVGELLGELAACGEEIEVMGDRGRNRLLRRLLRISGYCSRRDCARLALLASGSSGQLTILRQLEGANAEQQLSLWTQVVHRCLSSQRPAVLGVLAMAAWLTGDGALQMVCLEELERGEPRQPIVSLLEVLNSQVVPPYEWELVRVPLLERLAEELAETECRAGKGWR